MLGFFFFLRPMASSRSQALPGVLLGASIFEVGVFSLQGGFVALSDTEIKRAKAKQKVDSIRDSGGLYLWITPAGGKLWRWAYRYDGKEKLMSLGKYPDVSLALARERHGEVRKVLASGIDPMAQRKAAKTAQRAAHENSFQSVAMRWREHWQDGKSPRHVDYVKRRMEADVLPCLGARPIAEIEAPELVAMTKAIEGRGARDIAKRALETTGQVFRYAIAHGYSGASPASTWTSLHSRANMLPTSAERRLEPRCMASTRQVPLNQIQAMPRDGAMRE